MKTILEANTIDELIKAGYKGDSIVLVAVMDDLSEIPKGELACTLSWSKKVIRTIKQNNSIYKYCSMLSKTLNDGGITKKMYFAKKTFDVSWTQESVLEDIWREFQFALFKHRKTSKLETVDVSEVYKEVDKVMLSAFDIDLSFPNRFND